MTGRFPSQLGTVALVGSLIAVPARAQDTRTESLSQERVPKAEDVSSPPADPGPGKLQRSFTWTMTMVGRSGGTSNGFYARLGGQIPGSGLISIGPGYRHRLFGDAAVMDTWAVVSRNRSSIVQSRIEWPALFSDRLSIGGQVRYQNLTQLNYFGRGPDSVESAQTDYQLRNVDVAASATVHLRGWLSAGGRFGQISGLGIHPGLSTLHPSIETGFDETTAPGLTVQTPFRHGDVAVIADTRDVRGNPTSGGLYSADLATYIDLDGTGHSFRQFQADATQYVPIFHKNWVVVVRSRVAMSQTGADNEVPFYLMPTLGGRDSLRGYDDYRFRDRNSALLSAEYQWPVFRMMDAALFVDAGTVAPKAGDLWREQPKHDYGLGIRVHSTTNSFARIDIARGPEGTRVLVSLTALAGVASRSVIPYVR